MKLYVLHGSHALVVVVARNEAEACATAPEYFGSVRHVEEHDLYQLAVSREPKLIADYIE